MIENILKSWIQKLGTLGQKPHPLASQKPRTMCKFQWPNLWIQVSRHLSIAYVQRFKRRLKAKDSLDLNVLHILEIEHMAPFYTGVLITWIQSPVFSPTPDLQDPPDLSPCFFKE